ncbi:hypothetical protein SynPROSU1_02073 [Synechococcus sp. PROS-U-1]|nr:hypothetical protein SynPROSU1_02073 [Synechococcus sp. PROS-U-1]
MVQFVLPLAGLMLVVAQIVYGNSSQNQGWRSHVDFACPVQGRSSRTRLGLSGERLS